MGKSTDGASGAAEAGPRNGAWRRRMRCGMLLALAPVAIAGGIVAVLNWFEYRKTWNERAAMGALGDIELAQRRFYEDDLGGEKGVKVNPPVSSSCSCSCSASGASGARSRRRRC